MFGGKRKKISHKRGRSPAKIPIPNENITMSAETIALVANSVEMTGLSVNRLDRLLNDDIVRVGYSRDHRSDRPQVTVGLSMDRDSGMPIGLTVNPGNILDVTHFDDTIRQVLPLMPKDAIVVFDNGAYSKDNAKLLDSEGLGFVTRLQLNTTDDRFVRTHEDEWIRIDDDVSYMVTKGNIGRTRFIFSNRRPRHDIFTRYHGKAERD